MCTLQGPQSLLPPPAPTAPPAPRLSRPSVPRQKQPPAPSGCLAAAAMLRCVEAQLPWQEEDVPCEGPAALNWWRMRELAHRGAQGAAQQQTAPCEGPGQYGWAHARQAAKLNTISAALDRWCGSGLLGAPALAQAVLAAAASVGCVEQLLGGRRRRSQARKRRAAPLRPRSAGERMAEPSSLATSRFALTLRG